MTIDLVVTIECRTRIVLGVNLDTLHFHDGDVLDRDDLLIRCEEVNYVMVSSEEEYPSIQFVQVLHILLDIIVMGKHQVSAVDDYTIFGYHGIPVGDEGLVHLTSGLERTVAVLANVKMT